LRLRQVLSVAQLVVVVGVVGVLLVVVVVLLLLLWERGPLCVSMVDERAGA
jgi:hypothetical protein